MKIFEVERELEASLMLIFEIFGKCNKDWSVTRGPSLMFSIVIYSLEFVSTSNMTILSSKSSLFLAFLVVLGSSAEKFSLCNSVLLIFYYSFLFSSEVRLIIVPLLLGDGEGSSVALVGSKVTT